ncbi:MAG: CBS domain-containing protein [Anaerolineales bacterium]
MADYRRSVANGHEQPEKLTVKDISTRDVVVAYPDETVGTILRKMAPRDLSRVPVVARDNPHRLLGVIRRNDIVRAHEIGAMRRDEARRRAETLQSVKDSSAQFVDVLLVPPTTRGRADLDPARAEPGDPTWRHSATGG